MTQHSKIYRGEVTHQRLGPTPHAFTYPATFFAFGLDELDSLEADAPLLSHNQFNLLSLKDRDYLHGSGNSIHRDLNKILGPEQDGEHTLLISSPRYLGYAFNPVNFHLRMAGRELRAVVAEVNNTFKDRHIYPLTKLTLKQPNCWTAECPKDFHVSPFNNMAGDYKFTFRIEGDQLFLGVDLYRDGSCVLKTWIQGTGNPISNRTIWRYALLHPLDTALNSMPRILWQAAQLYYKKKLPVYKRPSPTSKNTLLDRDHPEGLRPVI